MKYVDDWTKLTIEGNFYVPISLSVLFVILCCYFKQIARKKSLLFIYIIYIYARNFTRLHSIHNNFFTIFYCYMRGFLCL